MKALRALLAGLGVLLLPLGARAWPYYSIEHFNGAADCATCHVSVNPGLLGANQALNAFGTKWCDKSMDACSSACFKVQWGAEDCAALRSEDTDCDGVSNAAEIAAHAAVHVNNDVPDALASPGRGIDVCGVTHCAGGSLCRAVSKNEPGYVCGPENFTCFCPAGYKTIGSGKNTTCQDIDECATHTDECVPPAECTNSQGGHDCTCPTGYYGDGKRGCSTAGCLEPNLCSPLTRCEYSAGYPPNGGPGGGCSACPKGYNSEWSWQDVNGGSYQAVSCKDIDECANAHGGCDAKVACQNVPGGRKCGPCPTGYVGDGVNGCHAVDTCGDSTCDRFAKCEDAASCSCQLGFEGDGTSCEDVDECQADVCGDEACANLPGTYLCACPTGPPSGAAAPPSAPRRPTPPPAPLWWLAVAAAATLLLRAASRHRLRWATLGASYLLLLSAACGDDRSGDPLAGDAGGAAVPAGGEGSGAATSGSHAGPSSSAGDATAEGGAGMQGQAGASTSGASDAGANSADGGAGMQGGAGANTAGAGADAPVVCSHSCQCPAADWCNPASGTCEPRKRKPEVQLSDVRDMLVRVGCTGCHSSGAAGDVDSQGVGRTALFDGSDSTLYASLTAGGVGCAAGPHRACVDDPASSLLATKTLRTPDNSSKPSVSFHAWSDPDLQLLLRWIAGGAPRTGTQAQCGNALVEAGETCDAGPTPPTVCPYGAGNCELCDASCKLYQATGPFCGDAKVDAGYEVCDDANLSVEEVGPRGGAVCGPDCTFVGGRACGAEGQACCEDEAACGPGLSCDGSGANEKCVRHCGAAGFACCQAPSKALAATHSDGCSDGSTCKAGICTQCGTLYGAACPYPFPLTGHGCYDYYAVVEGQNPGYCDDCGGLYDTCCYRTPGSFYSDFADCDSAYSDSYTECRDQTCRECGRLDGDCCVNAPWECFLYDYRGSLQPLACNQGSQKCEPCGAPGLPCPETHCGLAGEMPCPTEFPGSICAWLDTPCAAYCVNGTYLLSTTFGGPGICTVP